MDLIRYARSFSLYAIVSVLAAMSAFADDSKISPDLLPLLSNPSAQVNVIVQYNTAPPQTCSSGGLLGLGGVVCTLLNVVNAVVHDIFSIINAVAETLLASDVITLSNQSNVDYISLDRQVKGTLDYTDSAINAPLAWNTGLDGSGVGVAVIDSGVYS